MHPETISDRLVFIGILVILVFSPLAFGSVHVWAYSLIELAIFALLAVYMMNRVISNTPTLEWVRTSFNGILILFLLWTGMQMVPLPASWISDIAPKTFLDKTWLFDAPKISLAYSFHTASKEWIKLASYLGMFFLVLNTVKSRHRLNILIYVLILTGFFEALYAIAQTFSETPKIWWWTSRVGNAKFASGTFIGSNHFAFYLEMILPLCLGFMIAQHRHSKRLLPGLRGFTSAVQTVVAILSPESSYPKKIVLFLISVVIGTALLLSASRGGILSMSAAMFFMALLFYRRKEEYRKYAKMALGLCLIAMIYGFYIGIAPTIGKFKRFEQGLEGRLSISESLIPMLRDYPIFGVGWGNFRHVYPRYVVENYDDVVSSGYAHNDWMEAATETGVIGVSLLLSAFLIYLLRMINLWNKRHDLHAIGIGAGVLTGLISVAIHSFSDFSMHIPANPLTLAAVLGAGYIALHRQGHERHESFFYRIRRIEMTPLKQAVAGCISVMVFTTALFFISRHFLAEIYCPTEWNSTMNLNWKPYLTDIQKAISINPDNSEYRFRLAEYYMANSYPDPKLRQEFNEKAIASLETSVKLNPAAGESWYALGKSYSMRVYDTDEYTDKWLPLAEHCFDMAVFSSPNDDAVLANVAGYWVWRSKTFGQPENIGKFQQLFRKALSLNPRQWEQAASRVWEYYPDYGIVSAIVAPENETLKNTILKWISGKEKEKRKVSIPDRAPIASGQVGYFYHRIHSS